MRILAALLAILCLAGCGSVGDVYPPAADRPRPPESFVAVQRGSRIYFAFRLPVTTTEDLPLKLGGIELRAGPQPAEGQSWDAWAAVATPIPVPSGKPGDEVRAEIDAQPFFGRTVQFNVRALSARRRAGAWTPGVMLEIRQPLPPPRGLSATGEETGVRLTWQPMPAKIRIFRRIQTQEPQSQQPQLLATVEGNSYLDATAEYGIEYRYALQAESGAAESEISPTLAFVHQDRFPPAAPLGLTADISLNAVELAWDPSPASDLAFYRVYRDGIRIADQVRVPAYADRTATRGRYQVTAVDQSGNESPASTSRDAGGQ
jgi:predicted small lipoprotein YifL